MAEHKGRLSASDLGSTLDSRILEKLVEAGVVDCWLFPIWSPSFIMKNILTCGTIFTCFYSRYMVWTLSQRKKSLKRRRKVSRGMTWTKEVKTKERVPSCRNKNVSLLQQYEPEQRSLPPKESNLNENHRLELEIGMFEHDMVLIRVKILELY